MIWRKPRLRVAVWVSVSILMLTLTVNVAFELVHWVSSTAQSKDVREAH